MSIVSSLRPGDVFVGRYRIEHLLKSGGMGSVYVAIHDKTFRRVALKLMDPAIVANADARARFEQEARVATLIQSAHVVEVLDAGVDDQTGTPFLVMELLQGCDLSELVAQRGRLPPNEVVWMLQQAAKALDRAHAAGIVHRDLKPENLYLATRDDEPPRVKILDFGIAKMLQGAIAASTRAAGTLPYMAPEQTQTSANIGPATDVWALALTAYALMVGRSYWLGEDVHQLYGEILISPLVSAVQRAAQFGVALPPDFDRWFFSCVHRDPAARVQRASDAMGGLATVFGFAGMTPGPPAIGSTSPMSPQQLAAFTPNPGSSSQPQWPTPRPQTTSTPVFAAPSYGSNPSYGSHPSHPARGVAGTAVMPTAPTPPIVTGSNPSFPGAPPMPPGTSSKGPIIVACVVALAAIAGGIFYFSGTGTNGGDKTVAEELTPKKSTKVVAATGADESPPKKPPLREQIEALNPFNGIGSATMQRHEVTRGEFAIYLASLSPHDRAKARPVTEWSSDDEVDLGSRQKPVTWVSYERAKKFCVAIDADLPTAKQWSEALDGAYPWGADWPKNLDEIAIGRGDKALPLDVETSPADKTNDGIYDLAGNAEEWTSTIGKGGMATVRGASVAMSADDAKTAITKGTEQFTEAAAGESAKTDAIADARLGFRCVRSTAKK